MDDYFGLIIFIGLDFFARVRGRQRPDWNEYVKRERKQTWKYGFLILILVLLFTYIYS